MLKKPTCLDARLGALLLLSHAGSDAYWLWTACSKRLELTEAWQQPHGAAIDVADSRADCLPEDCGHALQPTKELLFHQTAAMLAATCASLGIVSAVTG